MRFAIALSVSLALILAGPAVGQLRAAVERAFPRQYTTILVVAASVCMALAVVGALGRIRERRLVRYALVGSALAIGVVYSRITRTGDPSVDAIERFHFVEYGLVTFLFYLAWYEVRDASRFILPVLAGLLVGTLEEWLQWFVPARVGEARDILLNLWAILCGLLFSTAVDPPARFTFSLNRASGIRVRRAAAPVLLVFAAFFHTVHLGYEISDPDVGSFRSLYTREELTEFAAARRVEWRERPPLTWSRYSREDQYFSEGIALVRRRNRCWDARDVVCAWQANAVLERYYVPVLDTPSYVSITGHRWGSEQRADAEQRLKAVSGDAAPAVDESIIVTWPKPLFWLGIAALLAALLWI